jgi:Domain of unknown function (DUF4410)
MRPNPISVVIGALALAGCAAGSLQTGLGLQSRPNVVLISDFTIASEVVPIDRGYTARLERKVGAIPAHQRRQRTTERVNDEIVATIIASLREAGLDARNGSEDTLTLDQSALVMSGNLRPSVPVTEKNKNSIGFGAGRGHVVAAMSGSLFAAGGKREALTFNVEATAPKREPAVPPKVAAARNAAIASIIAASGDPTERLSPDVEAPARRLGRAIADRILAFAKEQGWLEPAPSAAPRQAPAEPAPPPSSDQLPEENPDQSG